MIRQRVSTRWDESLKDHRREKGTSERAAVLLSRETGDTVRLDCKWEGEREKTGKGRGDKGTKLCSESFM